MWKKGKRELKRTTREEAVKSSTHTHTKFIIRTEDRNGLTSQLGLGEAVQQLVGAMTSALSQENSAKRRVSESGEKQIKHFKKRKMGGSN